MNDKYNFFSKRENQLKKIKDKKDLDIKEDNLTDNDTLNEEEINDEINDDEINNEINDENEYEEPISENDLTENDDYDEKLIMDNEFIDKHELSEKNITDINENSFTVDENNLNIDFKQQEKNINEEHDDFFVEDDFLDDNKEYDEDNIIDDLISNADNLINEKSKNNDEENELSEVIETKEQEINNEEDEIFYSDEEINENKIKNKIPKKEIIIKILIGIFSIFFIISLSFGLKYFMNNYKNMKNNKNNNINVNNNIATPSESINKNLIKDDILNNYDDKQTNETEEITTENESESNDSTEKSSLFIQNFKGYVVDIKNNQILISDLTYDKFNILKDDYNNYIGDSQKIVTINVEPETQATIESQETGFESEESQIETSETKENIDYKLFHIDGCEKITNNTKTMTLNEALNESYIPCEICSKDLNLTKDVSAKTYDYSKNENLKNIIFKKFNIDENTSIPDWVTIGSEVNITFIQDPNSLINDLVEISEFTKVDKNNPEQSSNETSEIIETTAEETKTGSNVWGENWEGVVAQINDRRDKENKSLEDSKNNLSLENLSLKESLETVISIGKASIVWFRVGFKGTQDAYFPELQDIAVELQTSNGSLINDSNIGNYGKKWIADDGTINFVIKNTVAGDWKVLFTKNIGTYLGNIKIEAVPITGFLQIIDTSAVYTDGKLKVIWNAGGVSDDNCKVQIYAKNGNKEILMYSGNTIDDGIHTVDMVDIDTKKIEGTTYDIYIKITDIDVSPTEPKKITATYITDTKTIKNIEIPKYEKNK